MNTLKESLWSVYGAAFAIVGAKERITHMQRLQLALDDDPDFLKKSRTEIDSYLAAEPQYRAQLDASAQQSRAQICDAMDGLKSFVPKNGLPFLKLVAGHSIPWTEWFESVMDLLEKIEHGDGDPIATRQLLAPLKDAAIEAEQLPALLASAASRLGSETFHGTPGERQEQYDQWQADIEARMAQNPNLSITEARRRTAEAFGVGYRTVLDHTKNHEK